MEVNNGKESESMEKIEKNKVQGAFDKFPDFFRMGI